MSKECIVCGMPMVKKADFPLGDESKEYCVYCAHSDGTMKSYDEVLESFSHFQAEQDKTSLKVARAKVKAYLDSRPIFKK